MSKSQWLLAVGALLALATNQALAQRRVTGRITGTGGEPLGSASVNVQGTTIGAYTADDGTFALSVPAGPQVLIARRIGYKRTVMPISATATDVTIRMEKDVLQLEKMVVTGVTTTVSSRNAANAVAVVTGEQVNRTPTPTLENALQARIPGAIITSNSGAPGGGLQVQMRGITSINAASSPLYVVDGVIVSNDQVLSGLNSITNAGGGINNIQDQPVNRIADLNPADIETIEVLKGASAGAIYGSKASNGVIIITTKRGLAGKPSIDITQRLGQYSISHKLGLRCFHSGAEALDWWRNTMTGDSTATLPYPWQPQCNDFEQQLYSGNGPSYETDLSVRGGSGGTTYYVGGLAKRDNAIQRSTYYQKQSLTANISQLIGSRFTIHANNQFIHDLTDRGISGNDNAPVVSPGDIFSATPTFFPLNAKDAGGNYLPNPFVTGSANPFQNSELVKNPEDVFRYIGGINATYTAYASPRQTLDFNAIGGIDTYNYNSKLLSPPEAFFEPADGLPGTIVTNRTTSVYGNVSLGGQHKFIADPFTATTSFGLRRDYRQSDQIVNQGRDLPSGVTNVSLAVQQSLGESQFRIKDAAYYAQEEFLTLSDRLLLTAAINAERSSVNGDPNKYFMYPKYAASYRLPWLPPFTDELKLRVAYGKAGNQPPYGYAFTTLPTGIYAGFIGARPSQIAGNPNIKPETSAETEGGVDMQFLNGRAALTATAYSKTVTDLILQANVAPSTGFVTRYINGGKLRNTGTEFGLDVTPVQIGKFSWVSHTTYSKVSGRILHLDVPCFNAGAYFSVRFGAPYICQGYSQSTLQAFNGWDTLSTNPVKRVRHVQNYESMPDFTMGFSNELDFGNLRLFGLLDWRKGGKAVDLTGLYFDPTDLLADSAMSHARFNRYLKGYAAYVEDAGFVKLRELTASYTLPRSWTQHIASSYTQDLRVELSGRNLYTWTKYKGYDPEVSNFSNQDVGRFQDVTPYPPSRSIFLSIGATF